MNDLIDRQQAIDALIEWYGCEPNDIDAFKEIIYNKPSAQPERTCVNCGRTANNGGWYADGRTRCPIEEHYALPKDGYCHLWEKRNVTDDDYPRRELMINRETYCKNCDRSIYGKYHDCDVNIENDGKYVMSDEKCYCKIVNGERAEKYPWERREE